MVTYTSLIATHQARLRCLLHKYILNSTDDELRNNDFYDDDDRESSALSIRIKFCAFKF